MIKVEVVFDDWKIQVNGYEILIQHDYDYVLYQVCKNGEIVDEFQSNLEQAIKYCMEN